VPLFGELAGLLRVKSILYDNGHTTRRRMIVDEFIDRDLAGILVHISTDPWDVVRDGLNTRDPGVRARAEAVAAVLWATPGLDPKTTQKPAGAGTVLYPIRRGLIANLLQRSYAIACVQAHIWHDLPLVEIPPLAWFEALERGRVVDRPKPEAPFVEPSEELGFAPAQTIPVSLDAVRDLDGVDMARVTYFVIGSEVPEPTWQLRPERASEYSIEVLGLTGVICGPGLRSPMFRNENEITALFEEVEANAGLSIEIEDLWIPVSWLSQGREPERGDVSVFASRCSRPPTGSGSRISPRKSSCRRRSGPSRFRTRPRRPTPSGRGRRAGSTTPWPPTRRTRHSNSPTPRSAHDLGYARRLRWLASR
jgi:hypothetical protein